MPVTKMINTVSKSPKPQRVIVPASAENSILDMIGARSDIVQKKPTTYKPTLPNQPNQPNQSNMRTTYMAPVKTYHPKVTAQTMPVFHPKSTVQTFHPKATVQTVSTFHPKSTLQTISTFHPKATLQTGATSAVPANFISTYHPKATTNKLIPEPTAEQKFSSRYNIQTTSFTPTTTPTLRPNVKHLLATIGLEPDIPSTQPQPEAESIGVSAANLVTQTSPITTTTIAPTTTKKPELTPELKELLASFGLLTNEEPPSHVTASAYQDEFHPIFPSALKDESLSVSEFRPLPKSVTSSDIEEKIDSSFEIKADDFSAFKPLPIPEDRRTKDEELETLLKSYGLLEEDERAMKLTDTDIGDLDDSEDSGSEIIEVTQKVNKMSQVPEVNVAFLSPELARVLGDIGVKNVNAESQTKQPITTPMITRRVDVTTPMQFTTGQVPSSTMESDYQKLHLLLDTIKQLDSLNANLTDEELDKLNLKNFNFSKDILSESQGPDPTYGFQSTPDAAKNEVKRQVSSSEPTRIQLDITGTTPISTDAASSTSVDDSDDETKLDDLITTVKTEREGKKEDIDKDTSTTTSTTEEPRNGSISDLAGSFGGNDGLDNVSEEPLPPPRKNGFYFFSDWNSFLEVGEEPDKVVVRFDPKIGDPSPFIPVKIP